MKPALPDISPQAASASAHSTHSSLREQAIGHIFLGQLLAFMWRNDHRDIEVLKSEVDRGGYDLVLESGGIIRHVQLKSKLRGSKTGSIDASTKLLAKPGGCIIWIEFDPDTLLPERYYWFGDVAGKPLPSLGEKVSRQSRGNSKGHKKERPQHRKLNKGNFRPTTDISEIADHLFGVGLAKAG
jgi:hypothetical protein